MDINISHRHWANLRTVAAALAALALPAAAAVSAPSAAALQTELSTVDTSAAVNGKRGATLRLTFRNSSHQDVYILAYETPLRGFERDLFVVERNGERMPYTGIVAFRAGPQPEDWIHLSPGSEVSEVVDISQAYDMRRGGTFTVRYNTVQQVYRGVDPGRLPVAGVQSPRALRGFPGEAMASGPVSVTISASTAAEQQVDRFAAPDATPDAGFTASDAQPFGTFGCQSPSVITSAQTTARGRAQRAYNAATSFNSWYQTWFGNTSSSVSTVRSRFGNAYTRLGQNIDYYCGSNAPYCSGSIIAYTYKTTTIGQSRTAL